MSPVVEDRRRVGPRRDRERNERSTRNEDQPCRDSASRWEPRCLRLPGKTGRHKDGKGSQRSTREVFNRIYAEYCGKEYDPKDSDNPLTPEIQRSVCNLIRLHLYSEKKEDQKVLFSGLGLTKGDATWKEIKFPYAEDIAFLKRTVERRFPVLAMAINYWAAERLIMEVLRRDKIRNSVAHGSGPPRMVSRTIIRHEDLNTTAIHAPYGSGDENNNVAKETRVFESRNGRSSGWNSESQHLGKRSKKRNTANIARSTKRKNRPPLVFSDDDEEIDNELVSGMMVKKKRRVRRVVSELEENDS